MNANQLETQFARMGARLKVVHQNPTRWGQSDFAVDVRKDREGEFFEIRLPENAPSAPEVLVLQNQERDRHLVLMVKTGERKDRFLCGHDEREWFVAAVPGNASTVFQAKEALKPAAVLASQAHARVRGAKLQSRRTEAYIRQGEWFFVPVPRAMIIDERQVLKCEPIRRAGGKAHVIDEVYRIGGQEVMVCSRHANGISKALYLKMVATRPEVSKWGWTRMRRNPRAFARGNVRHPDHATIRLHDWHEILMNTENETPTKQNVAFLD